MRRFPGLSQEEADTEIQKTFTYSDLNGFIKGYLAVQDLYESEEDLECVFADLKDYLVRNGIVYAEIFASPSSLVKKGFDFFKMVEIYRRNIMKIKFETGIVVRILIDVSRTFGMENAEKNLQLLLALELDLAVQKKKVLQSFLVKFLQRHGRTTLQQLHMPVKTWALNPSGMQ